MVVRALQNASIPNLVGNAKLERAGETRRGQRGRIEHATTKKVRQLHTGRKARKRSALIFATPDKLYLIMVDLKNQSFKFKAEFDI